MAGNLREAQKRMTRQRLLDAAVESFRRQGYAATTVDDVVTGAGATRPRTARPSFSRAGLTSSPRPPLPGFETGSPNAASRSLDWLMASKRLL